MTDLEMWGGLECTVNRVQDRWHDQIARTGHDRRPDDIDRLAGLGIRALRYPVLWERLAPHGLDDIAWDATDAGLARLAELGVRPVVGLVHHGSGPAGTSLIDPAFPERLATFAGLVAERYPWVTDYTPVNEPLTTARFSGLYGHWYPHGRDTRTFVRAFLTQMRGIVLAMRAIRRVTPEARLVQTEDCGRPFGTKGTARQVEHEEHRRWLTWDLLAGRVTEHHPLRAWLVANGATAADLAFFAEGDGTPDLLGLNYYLTSDRFLDENLDRYPAALHGGNGVQAYADVEAVRAYGGGVAGHEAHLTAAWDRYRIPVALTEVHLGCTREEQVRWLAEAWHAAHAARERGVDVRAVTAWALLGSCDWNSLVTQDAGHYEPGAFDIRAPTPRPTALATAIRALANKTAMSHPAVSGPGWWRRSDRMACAPRTHPAGNRPPLLIVGATGALGVAFERRCMVRGLRAHLVGRQDMELADPTSIDALIRHVAPWAVINAAGSGPRDAIEWDRAPGWSESVTLPVNLAAACRRRNLPFVTFSSDLVFDGRNGRAYGEDDAPNPLTVCGQIEAEAERRVLALQPEALIVRSGALFGPWDPDDCLATLIRALDAGRPFAVPANTTISPTYLPHLVDAALDLLIDGERGVWHLANAGAVTWAEFASRAAVLCGRPTDALHQAASSRLWDSALRPFASVLTSARGALMPSLTDGLAAWAREWNDPAIAKGSSACVSP